ncbi:MAG: lysylphosphatidylglycerol synthase transmembrane domain-containing protein [Humidesulfovibrio sp.]|nr:lysylphosphatidylglycerol synthase transmembrane domain-containing protein [Humidesulfovibrio sp.]
MITRTWRGAASLTLGLAVFAGIAVWLARAVDLEVLADILRQARPLPLLLLAVLPAVTSTVRAVRLHVVLQQKGGLRHTFHTSNIGAMVNCLLPLRSGELCLAFLLGPRLPGGRSEALARIFVDRLLDILAVLALFAAALPQLRRAGPGALASGETFRLIFGGAAILVGALWALCAAEPLVLRTAHVLARILRRETTTWERRATAILHGTRALFRGRVLLVAGALSLAAWGLVALTFQAGMAALFPPPGLVCAILAMSMTILGLIIAPMPSGIGTTHGAIVLALGFYGIGAEQALAFAILYHAASTLVSLLLGSLGLWALGLSLGRLLKGAGAIPSAGDSRTP